MPLATWRVKIYRQNAAQRFVNWLGVGEVGEIGSICQLCIISLHPSIAHAPFVLYRNKRELIAVDVAQVSVALVTQIRSRIVICQRLGLFLLLTVRNQSVPT